MANYGLYITYEDLKTYLGIATTETGDDTLLKAIVEVSSRSWDRWTARWFYPRVETRYYDHPEYNPSVLRLDADLLSVTTLTTENTGTTIDSDDILLACGDSWNTTPYDRVILKFDGTTTTFSFSGTPQKANALTGIWGYHEDWDSAWLNTNDTLQAAVTSTTATSITVSDADGADLFGTTPRFKVGQLLKIDDEYLYLTAKDTDTNVLTVRRGVNGTTAATHDNGSTVYVYRPDDVVVQIVRRLASFLYRQKDSNVFSTMAFPDAGIMEVPAAVPADVKLLVTMFRRSEAWGVG